MSKKRKSFILHHDSLNVLDDLTNEQAGLLFKAIKAYHLNDDIELDALTNIAMSPFRNQFERDAEKYEQLCEKNRKIAESRYNTKSTTGKSGNQPLPDSTKSTDNDSKSDSKSDSKNKRSNNTVSQSLDYSSWPSLPSDQVLKDWVAMRKRLKANVTQTVINRISKQLHIAFESGLTVDECLSECILRNWRGFEYEWVKNKVSNINDISNNQYRSGEL